MKLRCLIVDDEPPAIEVLRSYITSIPMLEVAGECQHAMAAFDFLQTQSVDLLFLDIRMPKLSGTDLLKILNHPPRVILTTAHREFAVDGFDYNAVDFLLKPISLDRFLKAVQKVIPQKQGIGEAAAPESRRFVYFRSDRRMVKVLLEEITFVESMKDYVQVFGPASQVVTRQTISSIQEMLPPDEFIRVHRSFVVAVNKISSYTNHAVFVGRQEIPIGPLYRNEVAKRLAMSWNE
jgi:DNA-binding LytR/AlgR family response regulator